MLGNINYPVKAKLVIALKNGEKFVFTCSLPETEKQLIERLYDLSTRAELREDPRQLSLHTQIKGPMTITTVSGQVIETKDGIKWEVVKGVPSPLVSEPKPEIKSKADCGHYGIYCGTEKCPYTFYDCSDRIAGNVLRVETEQARDAAKETVAQKGKKKRGRPTKAETEARRAAQLRAEESRQIDSCAEYPLGCGNRSCPLPETECYRRKDGRKEQRDIVDKGGDSQSPKHSGELCSGKIVHCESICRSSNCVHYRKRYIDWSACKGEGYPVDCEHCNLKACIFQSPPNNRLCAIENSDCDGCQNPYCVYSLFQNPEKRIAAINEHLGVPSSDIYAVEEVHGKCEQPITISCLDECRDTGCKYNHATPMCKTGFPKLCNTTCEQDKCVFYRWNK